ncbi:hypothetical protein M378DRAFT_160964 [Amanita muscaria Koide BX008]|uniref:Uncharacterized protein n=1 Tax=Amanita muscaria (strain Koide BX008) TaxID=946122 RepID=A0A0C2XC99_AMAMK|nr:hypothetical protein M378DRAFT_160964 [Amanita muscaria Koide BX008]
MDDMSPYLHPFRRWFESEPIEFYRIRYGDRLQHSWHDEWHMDDMSPYLHPSDARQRQASN